MTGQDDEHVDGPRDDVDTGDEDEEPVVDAGGGKEADGVAATEDGDDAEANVEEGDQ